MQNVPEPEKGGSRLSSLDYSRTNEGKNKQLSEVSALKVIKINSFVALMKLTILISL